LGDGSKLVAITLFATKNKKKKKGNGMLVLSPSLLQT
jgi:hypothetical protein